MNPQEIAENVSWFDKALNSAATPAIVAVVLGIVAHWIVKAFEYQIFKGGLNRRKEVVVSYLLTLVMFAVLCAVHPHLTVADNIMLGIVASFASV